MALCCYTIFPFCKKEKKKVCNVCDFIHSCCTMALVLYACVLSFSHAHTCAHTYIHSNIPENPITVFILLPSAGAVKHLHTKGEHLGKGGSTIKACVCECVNVCERKEVANEIETCYIFLWRF